MAFLQISVFDTHTPENKTMLPSFASPSLLVKKLPALENRLAKSKGF